MALFGVLLLVRAIHPLALLAVAVGLGIQLANLYTAHQRRAAALTRFASIAVAGVLLVTSALCWLAWLTLLSPKGEAVKVTFRREWKAEDEERLVAQLTAINSSLLRATRK